jgi:hypothetical protein
MRIYIGAWLIFRLQFDETEAETVLQAAIEPNSEQEGFHLMYNKTTPNYFTPPKPKPNYSTPLQDFYAAKAGSWNQQNPWGWFSQMGAAAKREEDAKKQSKRFW